MPRFSAVKRGLVARISADESYYLSELFAPGTIVGDRYAPIHARTVVQS